MSYRNTFSWSLTAEELTNCTAGTLLAEKIVDAFSGDPNYILRTDIACIFHTMVLNNHHATPAGKSFIAKINFMLNQHVYTPPVATG